MDQQTILKDEIARVGDALLRCFKCGKLYASRYFYIEAWRRRPDCCGRKMWATCTAPFRAATFN